MKRLFIFVIVLIFSFIDYTYGQNEGYLVESNIAEAQGLIVGLKNTEIVGQQQVRLIERAIDKYASFHYYAPAEATKIFDLLLEVTQSTKNEYYRFILLNSEYFSISQTEIIKADLARILDKSDYQFYDIVSLYHLETFKTYITGEIDSTYFNKLRDAFVNKAVPIGLLEKVRPLVTLANLGDTLIENSLINLVKEFHFQCKTSKDTLTKKMHYIELCFGIFPNILGRLNSKYVVEETSYLMNDNFVVSFDETRSTLFECYVSFVIWPKINNYEKAILQRSLIDIENGFLTKKAVIDSLFIRMNNKELKWKKTLNDVDK